jgi:hypothetical protein
MSEPLKIRPTVERLEDRSLPSAGMAGLQTLLMGLPHNAAGRRAEFQSAASAPIVSQLATVTPQITPTVPPNGDVNPYGVAFVPRGFRSGGPLRPGDVLVSNFNNNQNLQGTGTTIVRVTPSGQQSVFFQGRPGLGLTTALGVLSSGFVLVGNVPTTDGTSATVHQGSLLILDHNGRVVRTLTSAGKLDGPWDLTVHEVGPLAQVFISNVLSGTVTRIDLLTSPGSNHVTVLDETQIASGYLHRADPAALVVGPTGLAYDARRDVLYVASTGDNAVFAIPRAGRRSSDAGMGRAVFNDATILHGPLGLVLAPNGDLIASNGDAVNPDPNFPSGIVEFSPTTGQVVGQFSLDPVPGAAFGIALTTSGGQTHFAAVNDDSNSVEVWTLDG